MASNDIGVRIKLEGEAEYRKQIQNITAQQKLLKAELQNTTAGFDKNTSALKKNREMSQNLNKQVDVQRQKVDELRDMVEKASKSYQEGDTELVRWKTQLQNAEAELKRLEAAAKAVPTAVQTIGKAMQESGEKIQAFGGKLEDVGGKLTKTLTVPIVGGFAAATKASINFEDGMAKVYTIAEKGVKPISEMSDEILALSNRTGKGAGELAEAAYQALSASVDTENAVEFVSTAADLAKAGFLETAGAVDVLTTIINAYGYSAADAGKIADQLIQTQNDGKTTVDQLAQSMGQVIPTAAALNIPLEQLNAAYAVMTKQGINTANTTTYLNGLFTELADGGSDVSAVLRNKTGKSFGQLMSEGQTLGDVLQLLSDSVGGDSEAFLNLWGNVRAGRGALSIVNSGVQAFNAEAQRMQDATGNVATALETLDTKGAKARRALNQITNAGIEIGDRFAPYVEKAATYVSQLLEKWDALSPAAQDAIIKAAAIAAAIGPVVTIAGKLTNGVGEFVEGIGKILPAVAPVLSAIGPAIVPITIITAGIAGLTWAIKNWDKIVEFAGKTWTGFVESAKAAGNTLKTDLTNDWNTITTGISTKVTEIRTRITTGLDSARSAVASRMEAIQESFTSKIDAARAAVSAGIERIKGLFNFSWSLPQIKMPHFSWSWESVGGLISLPRIYVSWYKKAYDNPMLFNGPTVLPTASGFKGFGDGAGGEVVIGKNTMYAMIRDAVAEGRSSNVTYGDINVIVNGAPGQDVRELADLVAERINDTVNRRKAAFA